MRYFKNPINNCKNQNFIGDLDDEILPKSLLDDETSSGLVCVTLPSQFSRIQMVLVQVLISLTIYRIRKQDLGEIIGVEDLK